jgi:hypothetical protein
LKTTGTTKDETKGDFPPRKPRPQSVTVRSCDVNDIVSNMSPAKSFGDIRSSDGCPGDDGKNTAGGELEFRRLSLKKTGKTDELVLKDLPNDLDKSRENIRRDVNKSREEVRRDAKKSRDNTPAQVEETTDSNVRPEFHRISLRKVEKRDDYLEKETNVETSTPPKELSDVNSSKDVQVSPFAKLNTSRDDPLPTHKLNTSREEFSMKLNTSRDDPLPTHKLNTSREDFPVKLNTSRDDPPPLSTKERAFPFQSHDVKDFNSQPQADKSRLTGLTNTSSSKSPSRRSVEVPSDSGVPVWIAMARDKERQREERMQEDEAIVSRENNDTDDVQSEVIDTSS